MGTISKMQNKKLFLNILVISIFLFSLFYILNFSDRNIKSINIAGQNIKVELSISRDQQILGLSGREKLPDGTGMLFVFPKSEKHLFWMKDMKFDLDMIWIDEKLNVVYIKENARPELYPESYGPDSDAKYILEVNAGFAEKYNLKVGDRVDFVK